AVELAKLIAAMNATVVSARLSMAFPLRIFCFRRGHRSHMPALGGHCGTCRRRREDTFAWQRLKCRTCEPRCRRAVVANAPHTLSRNPLFSVAFHHYQNLIHPPQRWAPGARLPGEVGPRRSQPPFCSSPGIFLKGRCDVRLIKPRRIRLAAPIKPGDS